MEFFFTIDFNNSEIPTPVLAEINIALLALIPIIASICNFILSGSEAGKSILFNTTIIVTLIKTFKDTYMDYIQSNYVGRDLKFKLLINIKINSFAKNANRFHKIHNQQIRIFCIVKRDSNISFLLDNNFKFNNLNKYRKIVKESFKKWLAT